MTPEEAKLLQTIVRDILGHWCLPKDEWELSSVDQDREGVPQHIYFRRRNLHIHRCIKEGPHLDHACACGHHWHSHDVPCSHG